MGEYVGAQEDDRQESGVGGGESSKRPEEYESRKVSSGVGPVSEDGKITSQGKNVEPRLVLIEWLDFYGCSAPWQVVDMVSVDPLICRSVGWLLQDNDQCKVVVPHLSDAHDGIERQGCGDMTIPSCAIVRIMDLQPAG